MKKIVIIIVTLVILIFLIRACTKHTEPEESSNAEQKLTLWKPPVLPDHTLTPGAIFPTITAEDVCVPGYSSTVRDVSTATKKKVYAEYGFTLVSSREREELKIQGKWSDKKYAGPGDFEVDRLISLELGGSNSILNLWPESYHFDKNAHIKDVLENKLHKLVCDGSLTLPQAQKDISTNWIGAYTKYVGPLQ